MVGEYEKGLTIGELISSVRTLIPQVNTLIKRLDDDTLYNEKRFQAVEHRISIVEKEMKKNDETNRKIILAIQKHVGNKRVHYNQSYDNETMKHKIWRKKIEIATAAVISTILLYLPEILEALRG